MIIDLIDHIIPMYIDDRPYRDPCTEVGNVKFWCSAVHRWKRWQRSSRKYHRLINNRRGYRWEHRHFFSSIVKRTLNDHRIETTRT